MSDNQTTGAAGEFLVAAELARRGWVPSITPRGVERTDILAQHASNDRLIAVQVKTASPTYQFRLGAKNEAPSRTWADQWYVLVSLGALDERARFYVVPTNVVSALVYVGHRAWLAGTKRDGSARKDTSMRAIRPEQIGAYRDAWELLLEPASEAPEHLDAWVYDWAPEIGLPDGHPGLTGAGQALGA